MGMTWQFDLCIGSLCFPLHIEALHLLPAQGCLRAIPCMMTRGCKQSTKPWTKQVSTFLDLYKKM